MQTPPPQRFSRPAALDHAHAARSFPVGTRLHEPHLVGGIAALASRRVSLRAANRGPQAEPGEVLDWRWAGR